LAALVKVMMERSPTQSPKSISDGSSQRDNEEHIPHASEAEAFVMTNL
jgi:hypothetical protein